VVLVATVRALKMHGGVTKEHLKEPNAPAVEKGLPNLLKHIENIKGWGLPVVVAINHFASDTDEEVEVIRKACAEHRVKAVNATHWADGGEGALELAKEVAHLADSGAAQLQFTYSCDVSLWEKIKTIAQRIYGANDIMADAKVRQAIRDLDAAGHGHLPVCIAKTQYSFSTDPLLRGRPKHFDVPIREIRLSAGAGFIVVITGEIMTMPGLPKTPAAEIIDIDDSGEITGLS
jgi:formate--tetrahydrofolate ligase